MIESNIIFNFEDFKLILLDNIKNGTYYLIYDDLYFEEINENTMITREVYTVVNRYIKSFNIIKYAKFKLNDSYTTKELLEFINVLRTHTKILFTTFNPKKKECFLLFISTKDDFKLEKDIKNLLETER